VVEDLTEAAPSDRPLAYSEAELRSNFERRRAFVTEVRNTNDQFKGKNCTCSHTPAAGSQKAKRRTVIKAYPRDVLLRSFPNLPYDEAEATWHGRERARLEALGKPAPFVDGQIATVPHVQDW
jgi:hypothetical protein